MKCESCKRRVYPWQSHGGYACDGSPLNRGRIPKDSIAVWHWRCIVATIWWDEV